MQPLFHLLNGDLCYANISRDRTGTWSDFSTINEVSARHRPWMCWLERTLLQARSDVDWIVVVMHQVAVSSARNFNGADLGIRQAWLPLFDKYAVDLVLTGHERHFERSLAVRRRDLGRSP